MKKLICLLFLLAWTSSAYPATVYKWVDKEGVVNFTDDYEIVPRVYRNGIEVEEFLQEEGAPAPAHGVAVKGKEEFKSDIYGEDGTRWREKVLSWKNRLNEATSNYEKARNGLLDEGKGNLAQVREQDPISDGFCRTQWYEWALRRVQGTDCGSKGYVREAI